METPIGANNTGYPSNFNEVCQYQPFPCILATRALVLLLLSLLAVHASQADTPTPARAMLAVAGLSVGKHTNQDVINRYGSGLEVAVRNELPFNLYYVDKQHKLTLHIASDTDSINLVEVRSGIHVPNPARARLNRCTSSKLNAGSPVIAGLKMGSTRKEVVGRFGVPTQYAKHPHSTALRYVYKHMLNSGAIEFYALQFEFWGGRLIHVKVFSPTLI